MKTSTSRRRHRGSRSGTTLVEVAAVLPVLFAFIFGMVEYSRVKFGSNMLTVACRNAARLGSTEEVTTADTVAQLKSILSAVLAPEDINVSVKDASVFDTAGPYPTTADDFDNLPDIELDEAEPRQLFLVLVSVNYNDLALLPFEGLENVNLTAHTLMRHE